MCGYEASGGTRPPLPGGSPVPKGQACAHPASGAVIQRGVLYYMFESGVTEALKLAAATPLLRGMWQAAITPRTPRRAKWCRLGLRMRTGQHRSVPLTQSVPNEIVIQSRVLLGRN